MLAFFSSLLFMPYAEIGIAPLIIAALAGAVLGAKKNQDAKEAAARQRKVQAQIEMNSPWTGMHGQSVQEPGSAMSDMLGGAVGGLGVGQMFQGGQNADAMQKSNLAMNDAQTQNIQNQNRMNIISDNQGGSAGAMNAKRGMPNSWLGQPYGPQPAPGYQTNMANN